jgi:hypothetical protein
MLAILDDSPCTWLGLLEGTIRPTMSAPKLTRDILLAALAGFQLDRQRIDAQIAEVEGMLGGSPEKAPSVSNAAPKKTRGKRSAAVRKRMAEAQRARWAKKKDETATPEAAPSEVTPPEVDSPEAPKAKHHISPEGMKKIIAATKKRWRLQKAGAKAAAVKKGGAKKKAAKSSATAAAGE